VSTTVALPVVGCLYGVCQAGVSCVKLPKCPPVRVACKLVSALPRGESVYRARRGVCGLSDSTTVALPVVGCLCGVCQAGVSCVKLPKCPPLRVTCRHTPCGPRATL